MEAMKGIDCKNFSKRRIEKEAFADIADMISSKEILKEQMLGAFSDSENKGRVYAFYKKKKMIAYYIIYNVPLENDGNEKKRRYELRYHEIAEAYAFLKEEMEKLILLELKELGLLYGIKHIVFDDKIYEIRKEKGKKSSFPPFVFAIMGIAYGILIDNIGFGLVLGVSLGIMFYPSSGSVLEEKEGKKCH